ncbi:DMT family transporter [Gordonia jinghuaiqii]|nr:DMT family transporter [Gordonia jinghuaiqii]
MTDSAPPRTAGTERLAWTGGIVSAMVYGLTPTVAAAGYAGGVSPTALVFLRSLLGGFLLLGLAVVTGRFRVSSRDALTLTFLCGPLFAIQLLCFFAAINLTGAQIAVVLAHISPVFVLIASAVLLRRRPGPASWAVCGLMVVGVALVAGAGGGDVVVPGVLLALVCAAGYAAYYLVGEPCLRRVGVVTATGLTSIGSALAAGMVLLVAPTEWDFTTAGWVSVAVQGVIMVPLGIGGAYLAVRALGPVSGSMLGLLEPVVGVLAALAFLGESLVFAQWVGVAVVLAASALLPLARAGHSSPPPPTVR